MSDFDYIIIGAGSAGCVLANRLSADPGTRVLLVESGRRDRNPLLHIPIMTGVVLRGRTDNWFYHTEPEPNLNGRRIFWPRGKVLGGSSSINGMVYTRGMASDYDAWAQRGLRGWSFDDVLPYFKRSERFEEGASDYHGADGTLDVTRGRSDNPLYAAFIEGGRQAGFKLSQDFNGPDGEGFGWFHFNIARGRRCSAADAFLHPVIDRPSLEVVVEAHTTRILFEGNRATGIEYRQGGVLKRATATREVILSAGALNSPVLLMRSGIGPGEELQAHGVPVVHELPGVGRNLQDHLLVRVQMRCSQPITMHSLLRADQAALAVLRAMLFGTGPAAAFPLLAGAFVKSRPELSLPDLQCHFLPGLSTAAIRWNPFAKKAGGLDDHGFFANAYQLRPESRGMVGLTGPGPDDPPRLQPNYLSSEVDRITLRDAIRLLRRVFAQPAFADFAAGEIAPGVQVDSDDEIDAFVRATADTAFHQVGTCRMGLGSDAVVDGALRVHGMERLRVVDASVMPTLTSSNTHAPTVMIAEKAADLMRAPVS